MGKSELDKLRQILNSNITDKKMRLTVKYCGAIETKRKEGNKMSRTNQLGVDAEFDKIILQEVLPAISKAFNSINAEIAGNGLRDILCKQDKAMVLNAKRKRTMEIVDKFTNFQVDLYTSILVDGPID